MVACMHSHKQQGNRLEWARKNERDDFQMPYSLMKVQIETHRRFCCTKSGLKSRYKPRPKYPTKHVWAAICKKGRSGVCILDMDAVAYVGILHGASTSAND